MPVFQYTAKDSLGTSTRGTCEGDSALAVRQRLRAQGLFVVQIEANKSKQRGKRELALAVTMRGQSQSSRIRFGRSKISSSDIIATFSQLAVMCQSGDDLAEAVKNVARDATSVALRRVLQQVYDDLSQGMRFSVALAKHPAVFNETACAAIKAGEHSGTVVEVLERLTSMMRKDQTLKSSVGSLMMYPAILCTITTGVIGAMFFFVLPQFATVFHDMDRPAPPFLQFLLGIGTGLRSNLFVIIAVAVSLLFAIVTMRNRPEVRRRVDYCLLNMYLIRNWVRPLTTGRVFRLLGTMLENDVPLLECIRLCRNSVRNELFRRLFDDIERDILQGEGMSAALSAADFLPVGAAHMIATAERTGKLPSVLLTVGQYLEEDGERLLKTFVKILEPAIIVVLGLIVSTVVMSIILPLLDVTSVS